MRNLIAIFTVAWLAATFTGLKAQNMSDQTIYQFEMIDIQGEKVSLEDYKGKVVLLVNVASQCGLTPQYADLEEVFEKYKDQGFVVLGFPANNFGSQEPGTDAEIHTFCTTSFGVKFPMFSKISVKGEDQHELYKFLTTKSLNGYEDSEVQWNFQKYLVNQEGKLIEVISPTTRVNSEEVTQQLESLLN